MPRTSALEFVNDPSLFTPVQMQPRAVLHLTFCNVMNWFNKHLVSHRRQVSEFKSGWVVYGIQVNYRDPLTYYDTDTLSSWGSMQLVKGGSQIIYDGGISAAEKVGVNVRMVLAGLGLSGDEELAGTHGRPADALLAHFANDEIFEDVAYRSSIPAELEVIRRDARPIAKGSQPFLVNRHHCEFADQWYFLEAMHFASMGREAMVLAQGGQAPELKASLRGRLEQLTLLYARPCYLFDQGIVETEAYAAPGNTHFVHRLRSSQVTSLVHATIIEKYADVTPPRESPAR